MCSSDLRGCGISKLAYHFIAGVLAHAKAIIAVTCPTVNSYKRLVIEGSMTGFTWAPVFISYGNNNRTHMVRVPMNSPRVESRGVDISVNPYLGAAMMIGAGLDGIERELDPGDPIDLMIAGDPKMTSADAARLLLSLSAGELHVHARAAATN